jgi:hypothetical protein
MKIILIRRTGILILASIIFLSCKSQTISPVASPQLLTGTSQGTNSVETIDPSSTPEFFLTSERAVPTEILLPTLSPTQITDEVLELYNENGSCELPCWWGITPGKTSIQEVYDRFSALGEFRNDTRSGDNHETILLTFVPPSEIDLYNMDEWTFRFVVSNGIVEGITTRSWYIKSFATPSLANMLKAFGKPKEIWMRISPRMIGSPFYEMALFYPQEGVLILGKGDAQILAEKPDVLDLSICPQKMPIIYDVDEHYPMIFHLTPPNKTSSFIELNRSQLYDESYTLLDDMLTDMNVERFYEIYLNPLAKECFNLSLRAR